MMVQFDTLMSEGVYNVLFIGGLGDIRAATQPFYEARLLAQKAYALQRGGAAALQRQRPRSRRRRGRLQRR